MKITGMFSVFLILISHTVFAQESMNIETLKAKLKSNNSTWTARDNWMSHLSKTQLQRHLGLREKLAPEIEFQSRRTPKKIKGLPKSIDWRNKDGQNWVSPLLNQANCGSCVAFASIGVMESQMRIASGVSSYNISLSPQNLFACGGGSCEQGWMPEDAARFLQTQGVVDESCAPYESGATGQDVACTATCSDASRRTYRISNYTTPTSSFKNLAAIKQALLKGPLVTTLDVYLDFIAYGGGVYKHVSGDALGGHAVSIVGYNDADQAFIIRNSWGPEWGENGYGRVAYSDISGIGAETWAFEIPAAAGTVSVQSPHDYTYATGTLDVKALSTFAKTDSVQYTIYDEKLKAVLTKSCSANCDNKVDVSGLPDGHYEIEATAMDKVGKDLGHSARQSFVVANVQPQLSISFEGLNGTDLKAKLTDRIEFAINAKSSTVPMSNIEFHYKSANGIDKVKSASIVLSQMTMGWRTNLVPNDAYEIWMVGHVKTNAYDVSTESPHVTVQTQN